MLLWLKYRGNIFLSTYLYLCDAEGRVIYDDFLFACGHMVLNKHQDTWGINY